MFPNPHIVSGARAAILLTLMIGPGFGSTTDLDQFHGHGAVAKVNYDSLYALATPLSESPEGQTLVDGCFQRYGGAEHLRSLESFRLMYRSKRFMTRDSIHVTKSFQVDRKHKMMRRDRERILNGTFAWSQSPDTLIRLDGGRYRAELFSYLTLAMPLALESESFTGMRFGHREADSLAYIYLDKPDTLMMVIGIDPRDHLIKSSEGIIRHGGRGFVFINRLSDYREHQGYWFPHHLVNISMGLEVARSRLTNVEVNVPFDHLEFVPRALRTPKVTNGSTG